MEIKIARQDGKSRTTIKEILDNIENVEVECKCNTNCNPNTDKWCNTIVFDIYKNDNLDELPSDILEQMVLALKDKIMNN